MKIIQFIILIILTISCNAEKTNRVSKTIVNTEKPTIKTYRAKIVDIGHADTYEKLPKLTFEPITEKEFSSLEPIKTIQTFNPEEDGNFLYIQTALKNHKFKKYRDYGGDESWSGFEYLGYYPTSKLFAIKENSTSESLGFGQLFLLDSLNDYHYNIISFGDGAVELPIASINSKYFVYFYNSLYEQATCDIGVLKVNDRSNPNTYLTEYASYNSQDFAIEKIIWKTDHSFYLKAYQETYENEKLVKKYKYYKTEFE